MADDGNLHSGRTNADESSSGELKSSTGTRNLYKVVESVKDKPLAATPAQLFAGLPISSQPHVQCQCCGTVLYEGATVALRAARPADSHEWTLQRVCCEACSATDLHSTLGYTEFRLRCRLASRTDCRTQRARLVVLAPTVLATSPPTESQTKTDTDETRPHQEPTTELAPEPNLEATHGR